MITNQILGVMTIVTQDHDKSHYGKVFFHGYLFESWCNNGNFNYSFEN